MKKIRYFSVTIAGIILSLIVLAFIRSLGATYIESSNSSYEIMGTKNKNNARQFNNTIEIYTKAHNISAIKVFNVLPKDGSSEVQTKMHVYGKNIRLPKGLRATKDEFQTSDIRYPLYFIGNVDSASIEAMFKRAGIKYEKIHENWNADIILFISSNSIGNIIILVLLILLIALLLSNLYSLKKINIRALFGMSNMQDALKSWAKDQFVFTMSYWTAIIAITFYLKYQYVSNLYRIMFYFALVLYFVTTTVIIFAAIVRGISHSKYTIIDAIKGNTQSKISFYINLLIKIIVEIFITVSFVGLMGALQRQEQLQAQLSTWTSYKTLYTVTASPISTDSAEEDFLNKQSMLLFNYLDKHNGLLIDYQGWGNGSDILDSVNGNVMTVNAEYLRKNVVRDSNGKRILLPKYSNVTYILIPKKYYYNKAQIIQSYRRALGLNESEKKIGKIFQIKPIEIKNNQNLFTYSSDALSLGFYSGNTTSAALIVLSNNSLGGLNSTLDSNINWSAYMSDASFLTPNLTLLKNGIKKYGLTKYIGSIINTKSYASKKLSEINNEVLLSALVISIAAIIAVIENLVFNTIYFNNNKKKIAIQRLLGQSFTKRFKNIILLILVLSAFESVTVFAITQKLTVSVLLFTLINIIEIILLSIQSYRVDKQLVLTIKGE
ncbi:DUF1430 domain-containing protein [Lactobacillus mulieris]|uniref:DUF1430 domain-containing protein n=1 Tax=Lactobacillus mulieris TaxID=2508708 RepID=A0AAW5WX93_9LACO|nr:DUF1430 domain-containing protein [Lactobacillus mulieris]MCZ3622080.1 DUF1430 domain-containing protein [Lactobacillus mulieris]MCZ3623777.1 DUF1430 domain-containing protein [Lactobacillus mulieris]MCZ3636087.1 DUF1430 domain-containing protein [Lactobacillus mulieris]MCZ3689982.1 DUF1430 domain-containing protein [Lactobacillus mulieris]MCZ3696161.1 DUF1430 domain-containing protein [Lactobacillus mulieris]